jgi:hypothetical protein
MKKHVWISLLLILIVTLAGTFWFLKDNLGSTEKGFSLVSLNSNNVLLSDEDALYFNATNQEITLTDAGTQQLEQLGDSLYIFNSTVSLRINGREIYQGIFRTAAMSAIPESPKISILYPSIDYDSLNENENAVRLFYPSFQPPSELSEMNAKLTAYFQDEGRLIQ